MSCTLAKEPGASCLLSYLPHPTLGPFSSDSSLSAHCDPSSCFWAHDRLLGSGRPLCLWLTLGMPETDHSLFFQGQLAGLCGNFDLKTINEMRTPEKLELTNPQEFGGSWATVEVKPLQAGSLLSLKWTLVTLRETGHRSGERDIGARLLLQPLSQLLTQHPQPWTLSCGLRTCTIPSHTSDPRPSPGRRAEAGKETKSLS